MKEVGNYVRHKRKQVGLTQVELAKKAGVGLRFLRDQASIDLLTMAEYIQAYEYNFTMCF